MLRFNVYCSLLIKPLIILEEQFVYFVANGVLNVAKVITEPFTIFSNYSCVFFVLNSNMK